METLCSGMEDDIKGGIHYIWLLGQHLAQDEDCGFLLIDTINEYNEDIQTAMLWAGRYEWPSASSSRLTVTSTGTCW